MNNDLITDVVEYVESSERLISGLRKEADEKERELDELRSERPNTARIGDVVRKLASAGLLGDAGIDEVTAELEKNPFGIFRRVEKAAESKEAGRRTRGVLGHGVDQNGAFGSRGDAMSNADRALLGRLGLI